MRKYIVLLFALACALALSGCAGSETQVADTSPEPTVTAVYFEAAVLEVWDSHLLVEPAEDFAERKSSDRITVSTADTEDEGTLDYLSTAEPGDIIEIGYNGIIAESYPAQINCVFEIRLVSRAEPAPQLPPLVMVGGTLYYHTGRESDITGRCGVMDGDITSTVDSSQIPEKDGQSNFGAGYEYQYASENAIEILMDGKWVVFEQYDE